MQAPVIQLIPDTLVVTNDGLSAASIPWAFYSVVLGFLGCALFKLCHSFVSLYLHYQSAPGLKQMGDGIADDLDREFVSAFMLAQDLSPVTLCLERIEHYFMRLQDQRYSASLRLNRASWIQLYNPFSRLNRDLKACLTQIRQTHRDVNEIHLSLRTLRHKCATFQINSVSDPLTMDFDKSTPNNMNTQPVSAVYPLGRCQPFSFAPGAAASNYQSSSTIFNSAPVVPPIILPTPISAPQGPGWPVSLSPPLTPACLGDRPSTPAWDSTIPPPQKRPTLPFENDVAQQSSTAPFFLPTRSPCSPASSCDSLASGPKFVGYDDEDDDETIDVNCPSPQFRAPRIKSPDVWA